MKRVPIACSIPTVKQSRAPSRVKTSLVTSCLLSRLPSRPLFSDGFSVITFSVYLYLVLGEAGSGHLRRSKNLLEPKVFATIRDHWSLTKILDSILFPGIYTSRLVARMAPPAGLVELRRTGHDGILRDSLKQLAQHEAYWNVMLFCGDGTLALNRLTVGLIFPQLQDEISVICPVI